MATYIMSDIHGHGQWFQKMLELISFSDTDTLYILGDVVDRGPDGIALLQRIKEAPNMVFLLGNHDHLLLEYINFYGYGVNMRNWSLLGNRATLDGYNALTDQQQRELGAFLQQAPTHDIVSVNGQNFYLVHAFPGDTQADELWSRPEWNTPNPYPGLQLIIGHTPTAWFGRTDNEVVKYEAQLARRKEYMRIYHGPEFICVDCGCGTFDRIGALACLRLDDMAEFYVK